MTSVSESDRLKAEAARCRERGDISGAVLALFRAVLSRRDDVSSLREACRLLRDHPETFVPPAPPLPARLRGPVSVVTCSIDPAKFERVRASYARAFGDAPWELVGIHDARSLAEGYARGLARAKGEVIVFAHDDIEILSRDLGGALARALEATDIAGIVGTTKLLGPAHAWSGTAFTRGRIVQPARTGTSLDLVVCNLSCGVTPALEAIDGVFMAARREVVEAVGFDALTFDGFHLYDIDFSYRAHAAGWRVGVSSEVVLRHDSEGSFDEKWAVYANRFLAKFPGLGGIAQAENAVALLRFHDVESLLAYCARFDEAGRMAMGTRAASRLA
jgi:hypothetical protein